MYTILLGNTAFKAVWLRANAKYLLNAITVKNSAGTELAGIPAQMLNVSIGLTKKFGNMDNDKLLIATFGDNKNWNTPWVVG